MTVLRRKVFRHTRHASDEALEAYLVRVFFENPWASPDQPCYVYEADGGEIVGFIGVIPRDAGIGDRVLRAAIATQLMVHPAHRGVAGIRLIQRLMTGPQDLLYADVANEPVSALWLGVGGSIMPAYGLQWEYPVEVFHRATAASRAVGRALAWAVQGKPRAADWLVEPLGGHGAEERGAGEGERVPLTPRVLAERLAELVGRQTLYVRNVEGSAEWILQMLRQKCGEEALRAHAVQTQDGSLAGWYVLIRTGGCVAQVVQLVARRGAHDVVWRSMVSTAGEVGARTIRGRYDPLCAQILSSKRCSMSIGGPGLLVHARDPEILRRVLGGQTMLTGLDGEWWLDF